MASKDIEKLKEKFDKDPNSKLFLPLAEEYRKEGMLEEAIEVLQKGIEKHGTYTSARVLLGKMFLEKGMMDEARKEFEGVIQIVPDNLFAHKRLAEVYRDTGETDLAIKAFRTILRLNPMDDESVSNLRDIEAALSPAPSAEDTQKADSSFGEIRMPGADVPAADEFADLHIGEEIQIEAPAIQAEHSEDELNAFKDSLFGDKSGMGDEHEHDNEIRLETQEEPDEAGTVSISEDEAASAEELSFGDVGEAFDVSEPVSADKESEDEVDAAEELSFEDVGEALAQEMTSDVSGSFPSAEQEDTLDLMGEPPEIAEEPVNTTFEAAVAVPEKEASDLSDADRFVSAGKFGEAMGVYRKLLANTPNDKRVLQRAEELRALMKLTGKDKEVRIDKLNAFLEGIQKGRDGFLGHS